MMKLHLFFDARTTMEEFVSVLLDAQPGDWFYCVPCRVAKARDRINRFGFRAKVSKVDKTGRVKKITLIEPNYDIISS